MNDIFKNGCQQVKMIDFVRTLYKQYKILNKLSDKESKDFQAEIVNLLVDTQQNVDKQTYHDILNNVGFQAFILEILGNVINRTPFKNQFELNRNLDSIAETIKKQQDQLQKKQKILERKEEKFKNTEEQLLVTFKQKISHLEAESIKKITAKQLQIKKSINVLINQLKGKEKMLIQKLQAVKTNKITLKTIQQKQKNINERLKLFQKKQRQMKSKDLQQSMMKRNNQIIEMQQTVCKLKQNIKQINLKYKNLQLAYRKVKSQNQKLIYENEVTCKQQLLQKKTQKKQPRNQAKLELDKLQFSIIHAQKNNSQFTQTTINKLLKLPQIVSNMDEKKQIISILASIIGPQNMIQQEYNNDENEQQIQFFTVQQQSCDPHEKLLKQIRSVDIQKSKAKQQLIKSGLIQSLLQKIQSLRYPLEICNEMLEMMLPLMQIDDAQDKIADYLSQQYIITQLQKIYLCHQTNSQIAQSSTLILSRIKLWKKQITLTQKFRKAIQIRKKIQPENVILCLNIKYLL